MMTTTNKLTAMIDIEKGIIRDIENEPNFTISRSQLLFRIDSYCLNPDWTADDILSIFDAFLTDRDSIRLRD